MKYINNKIIAFTLIAASIMSCTDEYDCQLQVCLLYTSDAADE